MSRLSKIGAAALAAFGWTAGSSGVTASVLVVGGGGSGGAVNTGGTGERTGGGGGAGGVIYTTSLSLNSTVSYTVVVGGGGSGALPHGNSGSDSYITVSGTSYTANGGGGGGQAGVNASNGGSGGGGGNYLSNPGISNQSTYSGWTSYGNSGGTGIDSGGSTAYGAGGGGGAGGTGGNGSSTNGGAGANGYAFSISGTSTYYAAGGGGGSEGGTPGSGGTGGGGNGSTTIGNPGTANTGSGGGGAGHTSAGDGNTYVAGNGGSGVVIISYAGAQKFGGGVVTTDGTNTIHTFKTSSSLVPITSLSANYLIVAGGGSGGSNGGGYNGAAAGGGAGGLLSGSAITIDINSTYLVTVGAGGAAVTTTTASALGISGNNSSFSAVATAAVGGGGGGTNAVGLWNGLNGGSGGGGVASGTGGTGTSGQGNAGGAGNAVGSGGGGGGAGAVGSVGTVSSSGAGGAGVASSISGSSVTYAGGGGGGGSNSYTNGAGGSGGGGAGGAGATGNPGVSGTANTGGGGGASGANNSGGSLTLVSGAGGSGVVIISYPGSTQQMAGGSVTIVGGNVIHTFTSTGYLAPIKLVSNSVRFRQTASAYITRTPSTTSNRKTFTWSGWVKIGKLGAFQSLLECVGPTTPGTRTAFMINDLQTLDFFTDNTSSSRLTSTQVFRDPAAWYHIVLAVDTTQSTASNRIKMYVNGSQLTSFSTANYPSQNADTYYNTTYAHTIGKVYDPFYSDFYLTEINFVDGQQLAPTAFGSYTSYGVWQPITYGGSYGTNGFYLPFNSSRTASYAGSFNGTSQALSVAQNSAFNLAGVSWTAECWFYSSGDYSKYRPIFSKRTGGTGSYQIYLDLTTGILKFWNGTTISSTNVTPTANTWNHLACVQNGANVTIYLNGVGLTTFANTITDINSPFYIGNTSIADEWFSGYISNFRLVKGTAVYTSNFTPPTEPLTAISGTQLLTLQNSTIIDNSTNAFSITNTGSTTTSVQYPFSISVFSDRSPQQNNWTPVNISGIAGVNYDYMVDSPTLTSATSANYPVINAIFLGSYGGTMTPYAGNLQSGTVQANADNNVLGTMSMPSTGKYYWEVTITGGAASPSGGNGYYLGVSDNIGQYSFGWQSKSGSPFSTTYTTGDVLGFASNKDAGTIQCFKNGVSVGTTALDPSYVTFIFYYWGNNGTGAAMAVNFGQQPWVYSPPSGFVALNSYNLPTPTIPNGRTVMNATLYTGNGSTQTINNADLGTVGFKPDLVWIKNRNNTGSHVLQDSVRGLGSATKLSSNSTNAENNNSGDATDPQYGYVTAITSTGFTAYAGTTPAQTNTSNYTYAAWQWQAGQGTNTTNTTGTITSTVSANPTAGFSIVSYTGTGSAGTVGHGLGVAPTFIIYKSRSNAQNWLVNIGAITGTQGDYVYLNLTQQKLNSSNVLNANSSTFGLGTSPENNQSGITFIAYCWAPIEGYSKFGTYTGSGDATYSPFVYCGFRPRFILYKSTTEVSYWNIFDTARGTTNVIGPYLNPNTSDAEGSTTLIDILSNGFKLRTAGSGNNASGQTYIYAAFAENPFKYANAR